MVQSAAQILSSSRIVAHPLRVIAIGDSLVYGYGDHEGGGWTERLRRCWMDPRGAGHALYNLGVRGDGVQQVLKRLEQEYGCRGELRHRTPDLIVISVGTNDSARVGRPDGRNNRHHEMTMAVFRLAALTTSRSLCPLVGRFANGEYSVFFALVNIVRLLPVKRPSSAGHSA